MSRATERGRFVGKTIRVCHKKGRIVEENPRSFDAEIELGGVIQHVVLADVYVEEQLGGE